MPENKPQDNKLDHVSMDGPYSTVNGSAVVERTVFISGDTGQTHKDEKPADVVMVENEDYDGIVMVENDDYEECVAGNGNDKSDSVVMVENDDYERIPSGEGNGKTDGVAMVENENYEGIPPGD